MRSKGQISGHKPIFCRLTPSEIEATHYNFLPSRSDRRTNICTIKIRMKFKINFFISTPPIWWTPQDQKAVAAGPLNRAEIDACANDLGAKMSHSLHGVIDGDVILSTVVIDATLEVYYVVASYPCNLLLRDYTPFEMVCE